MKVSRKPDVLLLLVMALAVVFFSFSFLGHHDLLGGKDEGSYVTMGKNLSQFKGIVFHDPHAELGAKYGHEELFVPDGYYVENGEQGLVRNGWNKGYPLLAVPFWWIDNEGGWRFVNPFLSSLTLILLFLIFRDCRMQWAGFFVVLLLATSWLQNWFARYPMAEIASQWCYVCSLFCFNRFLMFRKYKWLGLLSIIIAFGVYVHFLNVFIGFGVVLGLLFGDSQNALNFRVLKQKSTYTAIALLIVIPGVLALLNYFLDPGLSKHYVNDAGSIVEKSTTPGLFSLVLDGVRKRWVNTVLFVPPAVVVFSILVGLGLIVTDKRRSLWLTITVVPMATLAVFLVHHGTDNTIYVGRRIVPNFLIGIYAFAAIGFEKLLLLRSKNTHYVVRVIGRIVALLSLLAVVGYQAFTWAPFNSVNKGEGMPALARSIASEMNERGDSVSNSVILTYGVIGIISGGFRYVYDLPIVMPVTDNRSATYDSLLRQALEDKKSVYFLDSTNYVEKRIAPSRFLKTREIFQRSLKWTDPNAVKGDRFPQKNTYVFNYRLYTVERK